jgi:acetylglutamate kinase
MSDIIDQNREMERLVGKARTLMEALPYIQKFRDQTVVIKYGGHAMIDATLKQSVMQDVILLESIGINPVIVHGGGPEITSLMDRVGLEARFVDGQRVTDADALDIAEMVLAGKLNGEIVSRLNLLGGRAVGLSGKDGNMILARKLETAEGEDLGYVGEVQRIDASLLRLLDGHTFIPVISPIGMGADGQTYNINADTVAAEIAIALGAAKLVLLTDVRGICRDAKDPSTLINRVRLKEIDRLIGDGIIRGGMIPKVNACRRALQEGVGSTHIIDGRLPHAMLIEVFTDTGIGTMLYP